MRFNNSEFVISSNHIFKDWCLRISRSSSFSGHINISEERQYLLVSVENPIGVVFRNINISKDHQYFGVLGEPDRRRSQKPFIFRMNFNTYWCHTGASFRCRYIKHCCFNNSESMISTTLIFPMNLIICWCDVGATLHFPYKTQCVLKTIPSSCFPQHSYFPWTSILVGVLREPNRRRSQTTLIFPRPINTFWCPRGIRSASFSEHIHISHDFQYLLVPHRCHAPLSL